MHLDIRPATKADREAILDIVEPIIRAGRTYPYSPTLSRSQIEAVWFAPANKVYVAKSETGTTVGTFYIRPNQPGLGDHICNAGFMVSPSVAGKGIGSALGRFALGEAKRLGYAAMQFNLVVASNAGSLRIWEKLGFSRLGCIPGAFRLPDGTLDDAFILHRPL